MPEPAAADNRTPQHNRSKPARSRRRTWAFRLAAVLLGLLPFVVLEAGLRAFDVARPTEYLDPYVGFSDLHPQFELDEESNRYVTTKSRQLFFGRQEFPATKPENGFRVFCLGGSTVRGRPYTTESAFAKWAEIELSEGDPETRYEFINCGGLSYASYRLTPILKEVLTYDPDLIVIATGHNEFLEDRTYQEIKQRSAARQWIEQRLYSLRTVTAARKLWDSVSDADDQARPELPDKLDTRLDHPSGYASYHRDDQWRRDVIRHYRFSLRKMIALCREADVPVVLVRLGANLRDCPPFKSEHKSGLTPELELQWRKHFDNATQAEKTDLKKALALYRRAETIDDQFALLSFRMARVFDRLEQYDEARRYYLRAKERDVCPLRILEEMADDVAAVAEETDTPLIDAKSLFREQSPQEISGYNFYVDHVHPTIGAHQQIAQRLVQSLDERGLAPGTFSPCSEDQRRAAYRRHFDQLGDTYLGAGGTRVGWVEGWAQRQRLLEETRPVDVRGRLHAGHRAYDLGRDAKGWTLYESALKESSAAFDRLMRRAFDLLQQGRADAAEELLMRLTPFASTEREQRIAIARLVIALETDDRETAKQLIAAAAE